jgi:Rrf2 family protein
MNISSRCEYACRAVMELANHGPSAPPLTVDSIAERRHIPEKFLVHVLLQLKRAGIVRSVRGARGGYLLARAPENVTLLDILRAVDGPVLDPLPVRDSGSADLARAWREIGRGIEKVLGATTIRAILDRAGKSSMYYI